MKFYQLYKVTGVSKHTKSSVKAYIERIVSFIQSVSDENCCIDNILNQFSKKYTQDANSQKLLNFRGH